MTDGCRVSKKKEMRVDCFPVGWGKALYFMTAMTSSVNCPLVGPTAQHMPHKPKLRRVLTQATAGEAQTRSPRVADEAVSPEDTTPPDIERVWTRIEALVRSNSGAPTIDAALSSILRDGEFATAWNNANRIIRTKMTDEELCSPVVVASLQDVLGNYRNEIQLVASAWGDVVRRVFAQPGPRQEIRKIGLNRTILPGYLDDDDLPIEMWQALRARDMSAVCYLALLSGMETGTSVALLAEYAERHCKYQLEWLDLLCWMYALPPHDIVPKSERRPWSELFLEHEAAARGIEALLRQSSAHPEGFVIGEVLPVRQ